MNSSSSQNFVTPTSTPQGNHNNNNNNNNNQHRHLHQQSAGGAGVAGGGSGSGSGNDNGSGSGSGSFVQRNSVQNQFAALSADRDKFVREAEEANKELQKIHVEHQSIRIQHDQLIEHNRQARATLGERMETLVIWKDKKARIIRETNNEGLAIRDCTNHSKTLDKKKDEATNRYIVEMDALNGDTEKFLYSRMEKHTEKCISIRSVEAVILPAFDQALRDNDKPQLSNQTQNLHESIEKLKSSTEHRNEIVSRLGELHCMLQERGMNVDDDNNDNNDQAMMIRLAQEEDGGSARTDDNANASMELFYGPTNAEEEEETEVEDSEYIMMTE